MKVVDELGQIFDGVDVVVGRGGDERHSRLRVSQGSDVWAHFLPRKLAAFSRFCPLRNLDFQLL